MCSVGRPTRSIFVDICCREIYAKNQTYQLYFVYSLQILTNVQNIFNDCLPFTYRIRQQINVFFPAFPQFYPHADPKMAERRLRGVFRFYFKDNTL